ncbi:MAG TPA: phosphatase PAP2 family protein [Gemmatimonadaceae bacterium]|nr:phosphatase PAP2 family protein [Gemmatimonadaceae bacterium]
MRAQRNRKVGHRSVALWVLVGYLLATLIPAWNAAREGQGQASAVLVAHIGGCILALFLAAREASNDNRVTPVQVLRDWAPLLAVPALYTELPTLIAGAGSRFHDQLIQQWEAALFGASPAHAVAGRLPWAGLSELLHLGYLSYYVIIYVPPLWLYLRGERREFTLTLTALAVAFTGCFAVFVYFPVAGPRYLWSAPPGIPDGPVRRFALWVLANGSSKGAAFPSSHVTVAITQSVMMLNHHRRAGLLIFAASLLLALGAVYGGFHYGLDVIAGAATGVAIAGTAMLWSWTAAPEQTGISSPTPQPVAASDSGS